MAALTGGKKKFVQAAVLHGAGWLVVAAAGAWSVWTALTASPAPAGSLQQEQQQQQQQAFVFFQEFHGNQGYANPELSLNLQEAMMNGVTLWPPVEPGFARVAGQATSVMLRLPGAPGPAAVPADEIERHRGALSAAAGAQPQVSVHWNLLPEWDQSGGAWVPRGRPSYSGLTREAAFQRFSSYYDTAFPGLMTHLRRPTAGGPQYRLAAVTDYAPNVYHAYELGVELQMLERGIDELGDLSTGIAFQRGAARQFARPWGIDISTWRTSTNGATSYNAGGQLLSGWSAGYLERLYYLSYAAGADVVHNEAVTYRNADGSLNPFGEATRRFADFALRRHPGLGVPTVNVAFLIDHYSGFDPKHGVNNQANAVWYQDLAYSPGDFMIDQVLRLAYPGHWQHGLTPGAPFADSRGNPDPARFRRFLAEGNDPRPFEPMPFTRWGDNIDVITSRAPADVLGRYRVIVLMGDLVLGKQLRDDLSAWVAAGGVLAINAAQSRAADQELLGVVLGPGALRSGRSSRWLADTAVQSEQPFSYQPVQLAGASPLAVTDTGDPLITSRPLGHGEVILTTPMHLLPVARSQLLQVGVQLLDHLFRSHESVRVEGEPVEFVIGRPDNRIVVTLANHRETAWEGRVVVRRIGTAPPRVTECIADQPLEFDASGAEIGIRVTVPPYGVQVVAVEQDALDE